MRIESVRAHPFGPFQDHELAFGAGLTVVSGGNETGKSSWHAATSTALVGRRKGRARKLDLDISSHEPWEGEAWSVSCVLSLDDGRRIRLVHNLAAGRSQAIDDITGVDLTAELMDKGGVDASTLVGLNRLTLPLVSSVRQAEILSLSAAKATDESVAELRGLLQKAVSSRAATDSSAEEALKRLKALSRDKIGTERKGSGKPLGVARDQLAAAQAQRDQAVAAWSQLRAEEVQLEEAQARVQKLQDRLDGLSASDLVARAHRAQHWLHRAQKLEQASLASPDPSIDQQLVQDVRDLVHARAHIVDVPARPQPSSQEVRSLLADIPEPPSGALAPTPQLERLAAKLETAQAVLNDHRSVPVPEVQPLGHDWSPAQLRAAAASLSHRSAAAAESTELPARGRSAPPTVLLVGGLVVGLVLLGVGVLTASAPILVAATLCLAGILGFATRQGQSAPPAPPADTTQHDQMMGRLRAAQLPTDPDALLAEAQVVEGHTHAERSRQSWVQTERQLQGGVRDAGQLLAAQLRSSGATVASEQPSVLIKAMHQFRTVCEQRALAQAAQPQRIELESQLRRALDEEQRIEAVLGQRDDWNGRAATLATAVGLQPVPAEGLVDGLIPAQGFKSWLADQDNRVAGRAKATQAAEALSEMLQGSTIEDLAEKARVSRAAAIAAGASAEQLDALPADGRPARPDRARIKQLTRDLQVAQQTENRLEGSIDQARRTLVGLAEVHEAVERRQAAYDRLIRLGALVDTTHEYLSAARHEVHKEVAPLIANATNDRLARVSAGRYKQIKVNPEDLSVQVELADGSWRSAESLSHGTTEQIYLLARIAIAETISGPESCPLILDDVTVHADSDRTTALLELLLELSADRQIILFSQEDAVRTWAAESPATTIELAPI